jgi:hypothetical protein
MLPCTLVVAATAAFAVSAVQRPPPPPPFACAPGTPLSSTPFCDTALPFEVSCSSHRSLQTMAWVLSTLCSVLHTHRCTKKKTCSAHATAPCCRTLPSQASKHHATSTTRVVRLIKHVSCFFFFLILCHWALQLCLCTQHSHNTHARGPLC